MTMQTTPLVLLPGLLCDAAVWRHQVEALAEVTSVGIADLTQDDTMEALAARVLAAAPPRFALACLSMGGYVAFEILRQAPERVVRLAILDSSAAPDSAERAAERRAALRSLEVGRFEGVTTRMLPRLIHADHVDGPIGHEIREMAARVGRQAFTRQERAILTRPDSRPLLPHIRVPTVVAVGNEDVLTPVSMAREIQEGIPNATLHIFETCGHLPPLERPHETSNLLQAWLSLV